MSPARAKATDKPRKIPKQVRSRATVDAILFAAAHLVAREGVEAASTNRIAEAAGVSIGSLYQYFPNKEAILEALRERNASWYEDAVRDEWREGPVPGWREGVTRALERFVAMHAVDPDMHRALSDGERPFRGEIDADTRARFTAFLQESLGERIPDPELTAYIVVRALEALVHGTALEEPERLESPRFVEELTELVVRYLDR